MTRKRLIEVALPLEAINKASAREKSIRHGHPSTLHLWWARRPLAAARAVIFAQMVDDPSEYVDVLLLDPTKKRAAQRELDKRMAEHRAKQELAEEGAIAEPEPTLEEVAADLERSRLFALIEELVQWENTTNGAGGVPAPRTRIIPAPGNCSTATSCLPSTIPSPGAAHSPWRRSDSAWRPMPRT
jgi:putative DNA methylase